jgi:D-mannonate dehydratase
MGIFERREFIKVAGAGTGAMLVTKTAAGQAGSRPPATPFSLGLASYTFRAFGVDDTIALVKRLGVPKVSFKSFHLPLEATAEDLRATVAKVRAAGLDLYAGGVIYMKSEAEVRHAFEYAKTAELRMIVGSPLHNLLPLVEELVRQTDIRLAIHNHGPTDKVYPTPESIWQRIEKLDRRIGFCIDAGHTRRSGLDPAEEVRKYADRMLDFHIKDVTAADEKGETCEMGRGVIDIPALLRTLVSVGYTGSVSLEFEKDEKDPLPGCCESIGYIRGVLASRPIA